FLAPPVPGAPRGSGGADELVGAGFVAGHGGEGDEPPARVVGAEGAAVVTRAVPFGDQGPQPRVVDRSGEASGTEAGALRQGREHGGHAFGEVLGVLARHAVPGYRDHASILAGPGRCPARPCGRSPVRLPWGA